MMIDRKKALIYIDLSVEAGKHIPSCIYLRLVLNLLNAYDYQKFYLKVLNYAGFGLYKYLHT